MFGDFSQQEGQGEAEVGFLDLDGYTPPLNEKFDSENTRLRDFAR